jgi:hypothetical protein
MLAVYIADKNITLLNCWDICFIYVPCNKCIRGTCNGVVVSFPLHISVNCGLKDLLYIPKIFSFCLYQSNKSCSGTVFKVLFY